MPKIHKKLTITLEFLKVPDYKFEGEWVGRDINLISRTIVRAYRKIQLASRQEAKISNPTIGGMVSSEPVTTATKEA